MRFAVSKRMSLALPIILAMIVSACEGTPATPLALPATETPASSEAVASAEATTVVETTASATTAASLPSSCNLRPLTITLSGTGSSFVNPIMQSWIEAYKSVNTGITINYQSTGSGQGKSDFLGGVTDFGGTDALFTTEEHSKEADALFIPNVIGAVVTTYNLEGISNLQFSPESLAGIFLGTITKWNDPLIAADNPGVTLPDEDITVVHRSDGSGTTFIFTDYLSKVSADWKDKVGSGSAVEWPVGIAGEKSDGVAAAVQQTPGAIGYVELIYALSNNMPTPAVKNAAGKYVAPSLESASVSAAGFLADMPENLQFTITNPPAGDNAYPIAGLSWLMVHAKYDKAETAQALADFICWFYTAGDQAAKDLNYSPLPQVVKEQAYKNLSGVTAGGNPVFQ